MKLNKAKKEKEKWIIVWKGYQNNKECVECGSKIKVLELNNNKTREDKAICADDLKKGNKNGLFAKKSIF